MVEVGAGGGTYDEDAGETLSSSFGASGSDRTTIEDEIDANDYDEEENESEDLLTTAKHSKKRKKTTKIPPAKWNHYAVLSLIEAYRLNMPLFQNHSIKNNMVWEKIRIKLAKSNFNYTRNQIITKFKYLKKLYVEKKDNMGPKSTGQSPVEFEFFEEFDGIFSKKPNIIPVCIVSSDVPGSAQTENLADIEEPVEDDQPVHQTVESVPKKTTTI